MKRLILLFLFIGLTAAAKEIQKKTHDPLLEGPGVSIDLIPAFEGYTPGSDFLVYLHIHHYPGFHTYWKNPGIVGVATSIEWTLPEGFKASEIIWPHPERTFMGAYPCHGYERDVTLATFIKGPTEVKEDQELTFKTKVSWMACAKGCFPGHASFTMTVPVTKKVKQQPWKPVLTPRDEQFDRADILIAEGLSKIDEEVIKIQITGSAETPISDDLYFFSEDGQVSSDQPQTVEDDPDGSKILIMKRSEYSPKGKKELIGVLKSGSNHYPLLAPFIP